MFLVGTCGALGTDDLLACFVAGNGLNWDGQFLEETEKRHDEVNSCVDVLLNFGGFMYIGTIIPWSEFHQPELTGITYPRLFGLGFMVLLFRRIPAILMFYKAMPKVCRNVKEALFMGYFGPIGAGAVFYLEHTRHLFPELGEGDEGETNLIRALGPGKPSFKPLLHFFPASLPPSTLSTHSLSPCIRLRWPRLGDGVFLLCLPFVEAVYPAAVPRIG